MGGAVYGRRPSAGSWIDCRRTCGVDCDGGWRPELGIETSVRHLATGTCGSAPPSGRSEKPISERRFRAVTSPVRRAALHPQRRQRGFRASRSTRRRFNSGDLHRAHRPIGRMVGEIAPPVDSTSPRANAISQGGKARRVLPER